ncbi:MAG: response regulator, partial [Caldimonas sp.]
MTQRPLRVLIVDDNPDDRSEARAALIEGSSQRYEFIEGQLADDAVRLAAQAPLPDCILLDFDLPDGTALDVLARLPRSAGNLIEVPVVILTGANGGLGINQKVLQAGAQDYLGKSWMGPESLTRAVENAVQRHAMARDLFRSTARRLLTAECAQAALGSSERALEALFERVGSAVGADIVFNYSLEQRAGEPG